MASSFKCDVNLTQLNSKIDYDQWSRTSTDRSRVFRSTPKKQLEYPQLPPLPIANSSRDIRQQQTENSFDSDGGFFVDSSIFEIDPTQQHSKHHLPNLASNHYSILCLSERLESPPPPAPTEAPAPSEEKIDSDLEKLSYSLETEISDSHMENSDSQDDNYVAKSNYVILEKLDRKLNELYTSNDQLFTSNNHFKYLSSNISKRKESDSITEEYCFLKPRLTHIISKRRPVTLAHIEPSVVSNQFHELRTVKLFKGIPNWGNRFQHGLMTQSTILRKNRDTTKARLDELERQFQHLKQTVNQYQRDQ